MGVVQQRAITWSAVKASVICGFVLKAPVFLSSHCLRRLLFEPSWQSGDITEPIARRLSAGIKASRMPSPDKPGQNH